MEIGVDSLTPNTITNSDVNANAGLIFLIGGGPEPWDRVRDDNVGSLQGVTNLNTNEERWATGARDPGHRLSQFNVDNTSYAVEHDAAGRTTRSLNFNLDYDPLNKLAGAYSIIDDTPVELYAYDAQGRLSVVSQFTSSFNPITGGFEATLSNSESIGHDGNRMVVSMSDTGFVNWLTFVGPLQDQILEYHTADFPIIPILDHRNNVVGAWDMVQAKMLEIADYNAEGRASLFDVDEALLCNEIGNAGVNCQAPGGMPFAFNGRWRSSTTGFVNMNHRWYSPRMGEFLSHDPLLYVDSYNLFGFATYDPINGYDPFGLANKGFFERAVDFVNPGPRIKKAWENINQDKEEKDRRWDKKVRGKYPKGTFLKGEIIECRVACEIEDLAELIDSGTGAVPNPKSLGQKIVKDGVKRQATKQIAEQLKKKAAKVLKKLKKKKDNAYSQNQFEKLARDATGRIHIDKIPKKVPDNLTKDQFRTDVTPFQRTRVYSKLRDHFSHVSCFKIIGRYISDCRMKTLRVVPINVF